MIDTDNPHYYIRTVTHQWGASKDLYKAIDYAGLMGYSVTDDCVEAIQYCRSEDELKSELIAVKRNMKDVDPVYTEFQLVITDADLWQFDYVNQIDGSPFYKWIGDGEQPKRTKGSAQVVLDCVFDDSTNTFTLK